jgi:hypothetical protein
MAGRVDNKTPPERADKTVSANWRAYRKKFFDSFFQESGFLRSGEHKQRTFSDRGPAARRRHRLTR